MAEQEGQQRRINRTLTQKYDMHALRELQKVEELCQKQLSVAYGCDEDDVPIEIDLLRIYNIDAAEREKQLRTMITGYPGDANALLEFLLGEMIRIEAQGNK